MAPRQTRGALTTKGERPRIVEFQTIQMRVSEASGLIDAARMLLLRDAAETEEMVRRGEHVPMIRRATNKRDQALSMRFLKNAVGLVHDAAGGGGLQLGNPIQRAARDIHAVGAHLTLNWDAIMPVYGRVLFDLEPGVSL